MYLNEFINSEINTDWLSDDYIKKRADDLNKETLANLELLVDEKCKKMIETTCKKFINNFLLSINNEKRRIEIDVNEDDVLVLTFWIDELDTFVDFPLEKILCKNSDSSDPEKLMKIAGIMQTIARSSMTKG